MSMKSVVHPLPLPKDVFRSTSASVPKPKKNVIEYALDVNHALNPDTVSRLTVGVIKHILYNRSQLPFPFDELTKMCHTDDKSTKVTSIVSARNRQRQRQMTITLSQLNELFQNLTQAFGSTLVRRVALVLGATAAPKEVHCIDFPDDLLSHRTATADVATGCRRHLSHAFRTLVAGDTRVWPELAPTNITVMMLMPRDCNLGWFLPRTLFRLPDHGQHVVYRVSSTSWQPGEQQQQCQQVATSSFKTPCRKPMFEVYESPMTSMPAFVGERGVGGEVLHEIAGRMHDLCVNDSTSGEDTCGLTSQEDFIWFQMPVTVKGLSCVFS